MSQTGPTSVLRNQVGDEVAVLDGVALAAGQPLLPIAGSDGTNTQIVQTDTAGNMKVVGTGVAGTQAGGVVTVQGDPAGTPIPVTSVAQTSTTATETRVNGSATSVTILASNVNRRGAVIVNDNNKVLYLKMGAGPATTTSYTYKMSTDDRVEVPANYTGIITGIWSAAGTGAAQVTEFTP